MRWMLGSKLVVVALFPLFACSDDGVPQEETGSGTTGSGGSSGGSADESAVTTEQSTTSTSASTSDAESTGLGDSTGEASGSSGDTGTGTGSESSGSSDGSSGTTGGPLNVGDDCTDDAECMTLVCWDFSDYDAACFGAACSGPCASDDECVALLTDAGADSPEQSTCGPDGRCTMVGTGFGAFACAAP